MAKIGLKCPVAAQITGYDSATGAPTYGNGFIIGKAVTAEKTIESNSNEHHSRFVRRRRKQIGRKICRTRRIRGM